MAHGGSGIDEVSYYGRGSGVEVDLLLGTGSDGDIYSSIENISGTEGYADRLVGSDGVNRIEGRGGNDTIAGNVGDDKLFGGNGDDRIFGNDDADMLYGGDGSDFLDGGNHDDILFGGAGADVFHFDYNEEQDVIKDFENNIDTIELDGFGFTSAAEALTFASGVDGDVVFDFGGGDLLIVENTVKGSLLDDLIIV